MAKDTDIKNKIKAKLDVLQQAGTLAEVIVDDFKRGILDRDYSAFPVAILQTSAIENETITNRDNFRTYIFEIVVLSKGEDVKDATTIEDLREAIIDKFDNDPTLTNTADGAVEPSSSPAEPIPLQGGKSYIVFSIFIRARAVKTLTF